MINLVKFLSGYEESERLRKEYFAIDWFLKYGRNLGSAPVYEFPYLLKKSPKQLMARQVELKKKIMSLEKKMAKKAGWNQLRLREDLTIRP